MKLVRRPEVVTAVLRSSRYIEINLVTFLSRDASRRRVVAIQMLSTIRSNCCFDPDASRQRTAASGKVAYIEELKSTHLKCNLFAFFHICSISAEISQGSAETLFTEGGKIKHLSIA